MKLTNIAKLTSNIRIAWILVFLFPLAFYVFLIYQTPAIYAWDAFTRLWEHRTLFVRHWLPLPQLPIVMISFLQGNLFVLRCVYATVSVVGAVTFGLFVSRYWGNLTGLTASVLMSFLPTFTKWSIVPYQEGFLLFCIGFFLFTWDIATKHPRKGLIVASSLFIALAELCRYEAWLFATIIACGIVVRRQWRLLPALLPALIVPLIWVLTSDYRDVSYGFVPSTQANPLAFLSLDFSTLFAAFTNVSVKMVFHTAYVLAWLGLPLMILGIVVSWKKGDIIGRELVVFLVALFLLSIVRGVNAGGLTTRMPLLFLSIGVLYLAIGLHNIRMHLPETSGKLLRDGITLAIAWLFIFYGYGMTKKSSHFFSPEAQAAFLLINLSRQIPDQENVIIIPRRSDNVFGESLIRAIFANSMKLDPNDSRWIYKPSEIEEQKERANYLLSFDYETKKYTLTKKPP